MRSCGLMDVIVACVLSLLLSQRCLSAPQVPGSHRSESVEGSPALTLPNPFGSGEEERRLLQSYIKGNVKDGQASPELNTWEQEIFYLFSLHDYDRSGQMDGLEVMKLLSDFQSHHSLGQQSPDSVVSMVDTLLQTQDHNQDGMLDPSELLTPPAERRSPVPQPEAEVEGNVSHEAPAPPPEETLSQQQPVDGAPEPQEAELPEPISQQQQEKDQEPIQEQVQGEEPHRQQAQGEQPHEQQDQGQEPQQQVQSEEQHQQQAQVPDPQAHETVEEQHHAPVHQGQPEM